MFRIVKSIEWKSEFINTINMVILFGNVTLSDTDIHYLQSYCSGSFRVFLVAGFAV